MAKDGSKFQKNKKKALRQNIEDLVTLKRRFQSWPSANRNTVWIAPFHNEAKSRNKLLVVASDARKQSGGIFSIVNPYLYTNKTLSHLLMFGITHLLRMLEISCLSQAYWLLTFQVEQGYGTMHTARIILYYRSIFPF